MQSCVYWIHFPEHLDFTIDGYVGVTSQHDVRLKRHIELLECGRHTNINLINAHNIRKEDILVTILAWGDESYCYRIEEQLRPEPLVGWNIAKGGFKPPAPKIGKGPMRGKKHSEEARRKMSQAHKGIKMIFTEAGRIGKHKKRKPMTEETKNKLRLANLGKKFSSEHRSKISAGRRDAWRKIKE